MDPADDSSRPDLEAVRQRRTTLRVSTGHLEQALTSAGADPTDRSCADVLSAAQRLQACVVAHIEATEGLNGFHAEMVTAAPRLAHEVEVLVKEHAELATMAADIAARSGAECALEDLDATRQIGARLVAAIGRHLQRGSDLIYEAFESEIGGET
ncbi:MAG: hypothetical protein V7647_390 [Acidobacteriota bacterium]|jgi:hypothetical protein